MDQDYLSFKIRSFIFFIGIIFILFVILYKLFINMIYPEIKPQKENTFIEKEYILRGNIYDRKGNILALSKRVYNVVVYPDKIKNKGLNSTQINEIANRLSQILNINNIIIKEKLISDKMFHYIKKHINNSIKEKIEQYNFVGIDFEPDFKREYPTKNLMSHIIGFVGTDNNGLEALEKQYNDELMSIGENNQPNNYFGNDIYLTIDKVIQNIVRENLIKGVKNYSAKSGVGLVYNPINSEILAICSIPDYNPYDRNPTPFSALAEAVEPGSVFKVFSSSLLFENDLISFDIKTDCGNPVNIDGRVIYPNTNHDILEFHDVFKYSSNVGIIRNTLRIDDRDFYKGILEYGFGKKTGIKFPIESPGIFRPNEKIGSEQSKAMISIGYEISVTPLQLAVALGSIVNGGALTTPLMVSDIRNAKGELVYDNKPSVNGLSPAKDVKVSSSMIELMRGVVKREGTGKEANIKGIDIIGKTGTAQRLSQDGTYDEGKVNTIFFGVVKFYKDPIVIHVLIEDPINEIWASKTAAPVFKGIVNDMIDIGLIYEY